MSETQGTRRLWTHRQAVQECERLAAAGVEASIRAEEYHVLMDRIGMPAEVEALYRVDLS